MSKTCTRIASGSYWGIKLRNNLSLSPMLDDTYVDYLVVILLFSLLCHCWLFCFLASLVSFPSVFHFNLSLIFYFFCIWSICSSMKPFLFCKAFVSFIVFGHLLMQKRLFNSLQDLFLFNLLFPWFLVNASLVRKYSLLFTQIWKERPFPCYRIFLRFFLLSTCNNYEFLGFLNLCYV